MKKKTLFIFSGIVFSVIILCLLFFYIFIRRSVTDYPISTHYDNKSPSGHIYMAIDDMHRSKAYKNADDEIKKMMDIKIVEKLTSESTDTYSENEFLIRPDSIDKKDNELIFYSVDGKKFVIEYPNTYGTQLRSSEIMIRDDWSMCDD